MELIRMSEPERNRTGYFFADITKGVRTNHEVIPLIRFSGLRDWDSWLKTEALLTSPYTIYQHMENEVSRSLFFVANDNRRSPFYFNVTSLKVEDTVTHLPAKVDLNQKHGELFIVQVAFNQQAFITGRGPNGKETIEIGFVAPN